MHSVVVNIATEIVQYPAGTATAGTVFTLFAPGGAPTIPPQTVPPGVLSATFDSVPDGVGYTATAQLLDGNSAPLGAVATCAAFDVVTPTVGIATPQTITVTVSA